MPSESLKEKNGVVVMLDALGAKDYNFDEAQRYIRHKDKLKDILNKNCVEMVESLRHENDTRNVNIESPGIITFGDTIIIYLTAPGDKLEILIKHLPKLIGDIVPFGLRNNIFWRGAIGVGPYFVGDKSDSTILGPAVKDAASWYEAADWIGIIGTPRYGLMYEKTYLNFKPLGFQNMLKYRVPVKGGKSIKLYALNWVYSFVQVFGVAEVHNDTRKYSEVYRRGMYELLDTFKEHPIFKGVEGKYLNTLEYYEWCVEQNGKEIGLL